MADLTYMEVKDDEYIKREAAMDIFGDVPMWQGYYEPYLWEVHCAIVGIVKLVKEEISKIPAADVAPVVHGRWIEKSAPARKIYFECSHCGAQENKHTAIKGYYCWRCWGTICAPKM